MEISRKLNGENFTTKLTNDELYEAYKEYVCYDYIEDVRNFLDIVEVSESIISMENLLVMAKNFYNIKISNEYTDDYAMAKSVIPELDRMEIEHICDIEYFESTNYLNCI